MTPPREEIEKMLADGHLGEIVSMLCLGAALAVKRGGDPSITNISDPITGEPLPEGLVTLLKQVHAEVVELLRRATAEELDCAIALYTEHLKAAGYSVEYGQDN